MNRLAQVYQIIEALLQHKQAGVKVIKKRSKQKGASEGNLPLEAWQMICEKYFGHCLLWLIGRYGNAMDTGTLVKAAGSFFQQLREELSCGDIEVQKVNMEWLSEKLQQHLESEAYKMTTNHGEKESKH